MLTDSYYSLKSHFTKHRGIGGRQWYARQLLTKHSANWPINEAAGATPPNWPGWPEGKQFAFVLTHDVDDMRGAQRISELLALDRRFGLRAAFNLACNGPYEVTTQIIDNITSQNCEVGTRGPVRDGKQFAKNAAEIRQFSRKWGSVGFRSPSMQHRLGWLHTIGCEYDSSTFDTDLYEGQPRVVDTIFPFWAPGPNSSGYVELPNTLPEDLIVLPVLREHNISCWTEKLDWIAERGGMALVNVHSSCICFQGNSARNEYPAAYFEEFLHYLTEHYAGRYWNALPREVSRYYCAALPASARNTRRRVCMLAYTDYARDNRVRRYAESLARRGDVVDSVVISSNESHTSRKSLKGVTIYPIQRRSFDEQGPWAYAMRLLLFLWRSERMLARLHHQNLYDVIHVHNIPDFLVFAAWYPKHTGARVILDVHDVVPELFEVKFSVPMKGIYVSLLKVIEKLSAGFADHVIISNDLWRDKLVARSVSPNRCSVFVNHVDPETFRPRRRSRDDGRYIVIFPGSFQAHQGLDVGINAFAQFRERVPNAEFHLYGTGNHSIEKRLQEQVRRLGLEESVKFLGVIPLDRVPEVISNADLGVVPKLADSFGNEAYSTKIMEFLSQGVPVVASRTAIDTFYFDEGTVHFFNSGDASSMAAAMLDVVSNRDLRTSLISNGLEYVRRNGWQKKEQEYFRLIDALATKY